MYLIPHGGQNEEHDEMGDPNGDELVPVLENVEQYISEEDEGESTQLQCSSMIAYGTDGTVSWIPNVPDEQKPIIGSLFESLDEAYAMYVSYPEKAGFGVRRGSEKKKNGEVTHKWFVCSKAGDPIKKKKSVNTLDTESAKKNQRNSNCKVTGCEARIKVKRVAGTSGWRLYRFDEPHNHTLEDEENRDLARIHRQLLFPDQEFIHRLSTMNIGPTIAHRLRSCLKGGAHNVRGTVTDFKNFRMDIHRYIGDRDAQMLVDKMNNRKLHVPNFSFDYKCVDNELTCMFWADEISKCHYAEFGSVLDFDATFRTNKYCMVFVPFTGVDKHYKCVTFGAGLLVSETIENYTWLLEAFMKAHGKQPRLVLTDQDAAMKQAIPTVLTEAQHRLCMWHITKKLPFKVSSYTLKNTDLKKRFHKLVWNVHLEPNEFERQWMSFIKDFKLSESRWFTYLWNIRTSWIPGYFRDVPLCGLMKTTSRFESSNSFFRTYSHHGNTLVQFMICFETAMEKQRHTQRVLDHATATTSPFFLTHLHIERHAASVYTRALFLKVQKNIYKGVWFCSQKSVVSDGECEICTIMYKDKNYQVVAEYEVVFNKVEGSVTCSCMHFVRHGVLCCHIFCVLNEYNVKEIPDQYVLRRWRIDALQRELMISRHTYGHNNDQTKKLVNDMYDSLDYCITRLRHDPAKLSAFVEKVIKLRSDVDAELGYHHARNRKEDLFKELLDVSPSESFEVKVPKVARNKGCGTGKRTVGPGEKAVAKSKRKKGMCKTCGELAHHDSRNCPTKKMVLKMRRKDLQIMSQRKRNCFIATQIID